MSGIYCVGPVQSSPQYQTIFSNCLINHYSFMVVPSWHLFLYKLDVQPIRTNLLRSPPPPVGPACIGFDTQNRTTLQFSVISSLDFRLLRFTFWAKLKGWHHTSYSFHLHF